MNDWYAMVNDLETAAVPVDELTQKRIQEAALKSLPKRRSRVRIVVAAALIALLTACGVAAAQFTDWFGTLTDPFAPEDAEDLLASLGTVIDQSQTVDGVTVTLHGALFDGNIFLLSMSVDGLEEERYSSQVDFGNSWLYYSRKDVAAYWRKQDPTYSELYLTRYEEIARSLVGRLSVRRQFDQNRCLLLMEPGLMPQAGREVVLHLENFEVMGQTVAGPFVFTFTPEKKDVSRTISGTADLITEDGTAITVTEVRITPLRIEVSVCGSMDAAGQPPEKTPMIDDIRLSGEAWTWSSQSGAWVGNRGDGFWEGRLTMGHLERIIDPELVEAIQIDGIWVELEQFQASP